MSCPRILIAGIGNIFLGDDAFGVEVAQRLASRRLPDGVRAVDFGIRGIDLTYAFLDGYEAIILVDAMPRGGPPGTLYVLEPEAGAEEAGGADLLIDMHEMVPGKALRLASSLGSSVRRVLLVGCEPAVTDEEMGLSAAVAAAVEEAVDLIESLVTKLLAERREVAAR